MCRKWTHIILYLHTYIHDMLMYTYNMHKMCTCTCTHTYTLSYIHTYMYTHTVAVDWPVSRLWGRGNAEPHRWTYSRRCTWTSTSCPIASQFGLIVDRICGSLPSWYNAINCQIFNPPNLIKSKLSYYQCIILKEIFNLTHAHLWNWVLS